MSGSQKKFSVRVANTGQIVSVAGKRDLLTEFGFTTARGAIVEGCRGGGCGICRIRVINGEYTRGVMSKAEVTEEDAAQGYALACKLTANSDLEIEAVGKRFFSKNKIPLPASTVSGLAAGTL